MAQSPTMSTASKTISLGKTIVKRRFMNALCSLDQIELNFY